jgi:hypothetical protein
MADELSLALFTGITPLNTNSWNFRSGRIYSTPEPFSRPAIVEPCSRSNAMKKASAKQ